ncbi:MULTISPECIES: hypothetical protein [unclassified Mycobacterium]|uniref:hypothetical protein n=1 Tax=unclassified Mycobacterium TaxID=2642494 RepID=UPI0029C92FCA|nr:MULTISPECIES: hypothetical protein [unclassified Mycobacterium]
MTNPWNALDTATGAKKLYLELDEGVIADVNKASTTYQDSLQTLINDALDDTTGYFGTADNPLAVLLEKAFNARGTVLTKYLTDQLAQTQGFVKTAGDAVAAMHAADGK